MEKTLVKTRKKTKPSAMAFPLVNFKPLNPLFEKLWQVKKDLRTLVDEQPDGKYSVSQQKTIVEKYLKELDPKLAKALKPWIMAELEQKKAFADWAMAKALPNKQLDAVLSELRYEWQALANDFAQIPLAVALQQAENWFSDLKFLVKLEAMPRELADSLALHADSQLFILKLRHFSQALIGNDAAVNNTVKPDWEKMYQLTPDQTDAFEQLSILNAHKINVDNIWQAAQWGKSWQDFVAQAFDFAYTPAEWWAAMYLWESSLLVNTPEPNTDLKAQWEWHKYYYTTALAYWSLPKQDVLVLNQPEKRDNKVSAAGKVLQQKLQSLSTFPVSKWLTPERAFAFINYCQLSNQGFLAQDIQLVEQALAGLPAWEQFLKQVQAVLEQQAQAGIGQEYFSSAMKGAKWSDFPISYWNKEWKKINLALPSISILDYIQHQLFAEWEAMKTQALWYKPMAFARALGIFPDPPRIVFTLDLDSPSHSDNTEKILVPNFNWKAPAFDSYLFAQCQNRASFLQLLQNFYGKGVGAPFTPEELVSLNILFLNINNSKPEEVLSKINLINVGLEGFIVGFYGQIYNQYPFIALASSLLLNGQKFAAEQLLLGLSLPFSKPSAFFWNLALTLFAAPKPENITTVSISVTPPLIQALWLMAMASIDKPEALNTNTTAEGLLSLFVEPLQKAYLTIINHP